MICPHIPDPTYFFISEGLPSLLYYSHFLSMIVSLALGFLIFIKHGKLLVNKILFFISILFFIWTLLNLILWVNNDSEIVFFTWSFFGLIYGLISVISIYFVYVFAEKGDISFNKKALLFTVLLPIIVLMPTKYNISGFDLDLCGASGHENILYLIYYTATGFLAILWIAKILISNYIKAESLDTKKQLLLVGIGIEFFLFSFFTVSFLASYLNDLGIASDYSIEFYGIFGMVIFFSFLTYVVVRFKLFNIKIVGANILVVSSWIMMGSLLFIDDLSILRVLVSITLIASIILGFILIHGVNKEVKQREHIESLVLQLEQTNEKLILLNRQKTEFVSFATHQLRSPLTSIKGYASLVLEGEVGHVDEKAHKAIETLFDSARLLEQVIDDYLNVSKIELGSMKYDLVPINFSTVLESVINQLKPYINKQKASFEFEIADEAKSNSIVSADREKMIQVLSNLIDNSFKYTPQGKVKVSLNTKDDRVIFEVSDTGIGMDSNTLKNIFAKYSRSEQASRQNSHGTGLGLFIAREIIKAHGGEINAYSEGEGKGSKFIVEIPLVKKPN